MTVHTKLNVTGRPAQFGRNILSEVGSKVIDRFAKSLAAELETSGEDRGAAPAEAPAEAPAAAPESPAEAAKPEVEAETGVASATPEESADKPGPAKAAPARPPLHVATKDDAIDLLEVAGPSVAKRAVPALGGLIAVLLAFRFLRRRKKG